MENNLINKSKLKLGFTIVELLVVIVVIGILASITIVSYTGVTQKAIAATLQSDLSNAAKQIKMFQALDSSNNYPTANNCPTPGATEVCLKTSGTNSFGTTYTVNNSDNPKMFSLRANNGSVTYKVSESIAPTLYTSLAVTDPANWIAVGNQVWAKANVNAGARINGVTAQTNNATLEKYCYSDLDANCTTYGALYQWDEAMQYVSIAGSQGICPAYSHIPTDSELKTLEVYLGMSQVQADASDSWRGTNQGTGLKNGGVSGLNVPISGWRDMVGGSFSYLSSYAFLWSSSEYGSGNALRRGLDSASATVYRTANTKSYGFSVRCIGN